MKRILPAFICILVSATTFAQKTEFGVSLNSGLFSFNGKSAGSSSFINYSDQTKTGYTNNPYGTKKRLGYGISGFVKRISKRDLIYGIDLGYELLKSSIQINRISDFTGSSTSDITANGKTYLKYDNINAFPFIGYRVDLEKLNLDFVGGFDFGLLLNSTEDGSALASNGITYKTSLDRKTISTDFRPRIQVATGYNNFGVYIGYSYGLTNYKSGYLGGTSEAYASIIRFGLTYKLK